MFASKNYFSCLKNTDINSTTNTVKIIDVDTDLKFKKMEFLNAINLNNMPIIKKLLSEGINPNFDIDSYTPLICAIKKHNYNLVSYLIKNGADVNYCKYYFLAPLSVAIEMDNINMVKLLLKNKVDVNIKFLISGAFKNGNLDMIKLLVNNGVSIYGHHGLIGQEVIEKNRKDIFDYLMENNFNFNKDGYDTTFYFYSALSEAIRFENQYFFDKILDSGVPVNNMTFEQRLTGESGSLYFAVSANNFYMVKRLLEKGANPCSRYYHDNLPDFTQYALECAAISNICIKNSQDLLEKCKILRLLLDNMSREEVLQILNDEYVGDDSINNVHNLNTILEAIKYYACNEVISIFKEYNFI